MWGKTQAKKRREKRLTLVIGSSEVKPGLALAPMAGITDHPFRILVKEQGCPLVYSEMISAKGLVLSGRRNDTLLYFTNRERPIGFQLFGSNPAIMAEAALIIEKLKPDFIDLNLGCPTPKIIRNNEGGALMRKPALCRDIFRAVVSAVSCPVTVKMRKGWDEQSINAPEIAVLAEENGIKAVTVHGRTVRQGYSGRADWDSIKQVKDLLSIPVIGNGDIDSPYSAEAMFKTCGCDGVMIGRAARGNPWLFGATLAWLDNQTILQPPTIDQVIEMILKHFKLAINFKGEATAAREMRRHAAWYIRGISGAAELRQQLIKITSFSEAENILLDFKAKSVQ